MSSERLFSRDEVLSSRRGCVIYQGRRLCDGKPCIIKEIFNAHSGEHEAYMLALIDNRCSRLKPKPAVELLEVFESNKKIFIVLEKLNGLELFSQITRCASFSEHQAARCLRSILEAIYHLHETAGITHNDIKPENIMFYEDTIESPLTLIDFGLSTSIGKDGFIKVDSPIGTRTYMAPEMLESGICSFKSDVWSTGVTVYQMLTGKHPYPQSSPRRRFSDLSDNRVQYYFPSIQEVMKVHEHAEAWSNLSAEARDLVSRMLDLNWRSRLSPRDALAHSWIINNSTKSFDSSYYDRMRSFQARRRFRRAVMSAICCFRMRNLSKATQAILKEQTSHQQQKQMQQQELQEVSEENQPKPILSLSATVEDDDESLALTKKFSRMLRIQKDLEKEEGGVSTPNSVASSSSSLSSSRCCSPSSNSSLSESFNFSLSLGNGSSSIDSLDESSTIDNQSLSFSDGLNPESFIMLMRSIGLSKLALPHIFHLFDVDGNGVIECNEFLSTLAALRQKCVAGTSCPSTPQTPQASQMPQNTQSPSSPSSVSTSASSCGVALSHNELLFRLFDIDLSGDISLDELKAVLALLMPDDEEQLDALFLKLENMPQFEEFKHFFRDPDGLFESLDTDGNQQISYEEFCSSFFIHFVKVVLSDLIDQAVFSCTKFSKPSSPS